MQAAGEVGDSESLEEGSRRGEDGAPEDQGGLLPDPHQRRRTLSNRKIPPPTLKDRPCDWKKYCKKYGLIGALMVALIVAGIVIVILSALKGTAPACECLSCPDKWTRHNNTCFFLSNRDAVWKDSQKYCEKEGGSLLILDEIVWQQLKELFRLRKDHWIGLRKDLDTGQWTWVNGSVYKGSVRFANDLHLNCSYINDDHTGDFGALDCSSPRPWICMKAGLSVEKRQIG